MRINIPVTPELEAYIDEVGYREAPVLRACRDEAASRGAMAVMQVAPEQGALLQLLVELIGARSVLEVGTFTGYSALAIAAALPPEGRLITCDVDPEIVQVARGFWDEGGVSEKIDARIGEAAETLRALLDEGRAGTFDLVLIDADKPGYPVYFDLAAELVRIGGLIILDDTLIHGRVVTGPLPTDPPHVPPAVEGIREVNARLRSDERFTIAMLPTRDGLTLARRRS